MTSTNHGSPWIGQTRLERHADGIFYVSVGERGTVAVSETEAEYARSADAEFLSDAPLELRARYLAWLRFARTGGTV